MLGSEKSLSVHIPCCWRSVGNQCILERRRKSGDGLIDYVAEEAEEGDSIDVKRGREVVMMDWSGDDRGMDRK